MVHSGGFEQSYDNDDIDDNVVGETKRLKIERTVVETQ